MKKLGKLLLGTIALVGSFAAYKLYATVPGQELISPTVYCHIYQDNNGNMNFSDASNVPFTLSSINPITGFTVPGGNLVISAGNVQYGNPTVAISTALATPSQGTEFTAFLASGSVSYPAVQGSVLVATTTQNNLITVLVSSNTTGATTVIGVAVAAASTGTIVNLYSNGFVLALTTGPVNPGDVLVSTAAIAGYLMANNSAAANAQVGIALQTGNSAGGLTRIKLK